MTEEPMPPVPYAGVPAILDGSEAIAHFGRDGAPSPETLESEPDRLENWRTLQEMAGQAPPASPVAGTGSRG